MADRRGKQQIEVNKPTATLRLRKTRTGCITCRVRRVKCDEAQPSCSRCRSTGRNCDGYSAAPVTRKQICHLLQTGSSLAHLRNPAGLFDNEHESRCFDFFRSFSAPKSTVFYGSNFWLQRVLQMCHSEQAVRNATLALSSLHRHYEFDHLPQSDQERRSALLYYSRAVSQARSLLSQNTPDNIERLLVICLLFICYENVTGNIPAAQMHLHNGRRIVSELRRTSSKGQHIPHPAIPDDILHAFSRYDLNSTSWFDPSVLECFPETDGSELGPIPSIFSSIDEAQHHLFEQFKWGWLEEKKLLNVGVEIHPLRQSPLGSRLNTWKNLFAAFQSRQHERPPIAELESGLVVTQIHYEMFTLCYNFSFTRVEISYDAYNAKFEFMLSLIDSLPDMSGSAPATIGKPMRRKSLSFERGIIAPLFFITVQCRDPGLRRQALARLHNLHCREGAWNSFGAARIAERAMEIEKEELEKFQTIENISNEKTVTYSHRNRYYKTYGLMIGEAIKAREANC